jgi:hypothetical protein
MFHAGENCAHMGKTLKIPSPTKLARLAHFPPASRRATLPAWCSMSFLCIILPNSNILYMYCNIPVAILGGGGGVW